MVKLRNFQNLYDLGFNVLTELLNLLLSISAGMGAAVGASVLRLRSVFFAVVSEFVALFCSLLIVLDSLDFVDVLDDVLSWESLCLERERVSFTTKREK